MRKITKNLAFMFLFGLSSFTFASSDEKTLTLPRHDKVLKVVGYDARFHKVYEASVAPDVNFVLVPLFAIHFKGFSENGMEFSEGKGARLDDASYDCEIRCGDGTYSGRNCAMYNATCVTGCDPSAYAYCEWPE